MENPTILIVDDETKLTELYSQWVNDDYMTITANTGEQAMEVIEEGEDKIDIVLLDRHMDGMDGDDVLREIRTKGYDCFVAMVTAVDPDLEITEMGFDEYVSKPMDKAKINRLIEKIRIRSTHEDEIRETLSIQAKLETLEERLDEEERANSEEYQQLQERYKQVTDALISETQDVKDINLNLKSIGDVEPSA